MPKAYYATTQSATVLPYGKKYSKVNIENECVVLSKMVNMTAKKLHNQISKILKTSFFCMMTLNVFNMQSYTFDDDEFDNLLSNVSDEELQILRTCEPGEAATWNTLLTAAGIPQALNNQFYIKTSLPRTRNIINFPEFQLCSYQDMDSKSQLTFNLFYNQTSRKNFTQSVNNIDGTRIGSYLNIEDKNFISLLDAALRSPTLPADLVPLRGLNYPVLLNDLANARLEERRLGFLTHYYHKIDKYTYFELKVPVLYMIKNLNFTKQEKNTFRRQFVAFDGFSGSFNENDFAKQHLIFDVVGLGDTELSLSTRIYTHASKHKHLDGGIFMFAPTDWQFARGLYGTYIDPTNQFPILDLCELVKGIPFGPVKNPQLGAILNDYFFSAIDHLSSDLLQCPLGYYQTLMIGFKVSPYWQIKENLEFNGLYTLECIFPYEQKRFFDVKDLGVFSEEYAALPTVTDADQEAKLLFLETRLSELLFPRVFTTRVSPGFVFTSASNLQTSYKSWDFTAGYSAWYQFAENFTFVALPKNTKLEDFDIDRSMSQDAYQVKLFGKAHHEIHAPTYDLSFTMWADVSIFGNNLGNDFTLGFTFDRKF